MGRCFHPKVVLVDPSDGVVYYLFFNKGNLKLDMRVGDLLNLQTLEKALGSKKGNIVLIMNVLQWYEPGDAAKIVENSLEFLEPGGVLITNTGAYGYYGESIKRIGGKATIFRGGEWIIGEGLFSRKELHEHMRRTLIELQNIGEVKYREVVSPARI